MKHYRAKEYERAALSFEKALSIDPDHKFANYNLACMYSLLFECEQVCVADNCSGREKIYKQLEKAVKLDHKAAEKSIKDSDFSRIRGTVGFWRASGYKTDSVMMSMMMPGSLWFTGRCSGGAYGCESVSFNDDKTFKINTMGPECGFEEEKISKEECRLIQKKNRGSWSLHDGQVVLKFQDGRIEKYSYPDEKGVMKQNNGKKILQDFNPDPCSA
jgi:tetratricopeptide (TPR) repeat protein